jgi:uncharacterized Tic20 family protein
MLKPYREIDQSLLVVRPEERPWGFLVHALGWVPVWGFIFSTAVWLYFKNRSREMVFHVQQAIQFQIFILIPILAWIVLSIGARIVGSLNMEAGEVFNNVNLIFVTTCLTLSGLTGVIGGLLVYAGKGFLYPLFGRRVLEGTIKKLSEE